ncbi:glycosyltransferase [Haloferacaceae archaeon DSL9]
MGPVAAFTDTYLPTVNGVTYTVHTWRHRWQHRGRRMDVVYPGTDSYTPDRGEHPVRSLPFPFYDGLRFSAPRVPDGVRDAAVVHAHTPFALGLAARRFAQQHGLPLVASYHTPSREYTGYLTESEMAQTGIKQACQRYEHWYFDDADLVLTPSRTTARYLRREIGLSESTIAVLSNGVDTDRFRPVDPDTFRDRHDLSGSIVGYTGRHGFEKRLGDLLDAVTGLDATVVFGGDGPARARLERRARERGIDARFFGFLDRDELPAFYAALDVFAFPSPVETQGLVALEAIACGTPVVGVKQGALAETIDDGETGYHYEPGDIDGFGDALERAVENSRRLRARCLDRRDELSVRHVIDRLERLYRSVS